jgi:hypothetical protein
MVTPTPTRTCRNSASSRLRIHSDLANEWLPPKLSVPLGRLLGDNLFIRATK